MLTKLALSEEDEHPADFFCKVLWPVVPARPMWSGFMQMYECPKEHLPMTDMNPSDINCVVLFATFPENTVLLRF